VVLKVLTALTAKLEGVAKPLSVREHQKHMMKTLWVEMEVMVAVVGFEEVVGVVEIAVVGGPVVEAAKVQKRVAVGVSALCEVVFLQHLAAANHQGEEEKEKEVTVEPVPDGLVEVPAADSAFHLVRSAQMCGKRERKIEFVALVVPVQLVGYFEEAEEMKRRRVEKQERQPVLLWVHGKQIPEIDNARFRTRD